MRNDYLSMMNNPFAPENALNMARELGRVAVFSKLSMDELELVASCCKRRSHYKGEAIFEDCDTGDDLFVILRGRISIRLESITPHYEVVITSLGEGQVVGEMALLGSEPRSASAVCTEPTETLQINGQALRALFEEYPHLGFVVVSNLGRILSDRLRRMNRRLLSLLRINLYQTGP